MQLKSDIQQKIMQEEAGMTLMERKQHMEAKILADPVLGPWFRRLRTRTAQLATVAEAPGKDTARRKKQLQG